MKLTIGMASYNNFTEVWFTVQALRLYHSFPEVEIVVVDNYGDSRLESFISSVRGVRYVKYLDKIGSAPAKNKVFEEALGEWVICIDSHILIPEGRITKFLEWADQNENCKNLFHGPLLLDDLNGHYDAFNDEWSGHMWGTWRGADIHDNMEPYEIPMMGCGLLGCRKDAWLGYNPQFTGFGAEEGYIHEKYRKAGHKTLCLPFLSWLHLFKQSAKEATYPLVLQDRIRNYIIGFKELGLDLAPIIEHFGFDTVRPYLEELC